MRFFITLFLVFVAYVTFLLLADFRVFHRLIPVTGPNDRKVGHALVQETSSEAHPQSLEAVAWLLYLQSKGVDLEVAGSDEGKVVCGWNNYYVICHKCGICRLSLLT